MGRQKSDVYYGEDLSDRLKVMSVLASVIEGMEMGTCVGILEMS